jgi:hypothetical protein
LGSGRFRGEANSGDLAGDGKNPFSHCVLVFVGRGPVDQGPTRQSDALGNVLELLRGECVEVIKGIIPDCANGDEKRVFVDFSTTRHPTEE